MKHILKSKILERRNLMPAAEIKEKSSKIKKKLYSLLKFRKSKNIMTYVSFNNEVDTIELIKEMLNKKEKNIIVPYTAKGNLRLSELKKFSELEQKKFGILEPKKEFIRKFNLKELDLVIVPGIVFDKNRHRIGYGYGYYDRFLKNLSNHVIKIGIAFEFQLVDKIPHEMHDVAMDIVITENFILKK